jgi:membrane-anchored mycosin MYCP
MWAMFVNGLRRALAVPVALAAAGLALAVAAAPPARAVPQASGPNLQPMAGQWWFPAWDIQTKVWPLSRGAGVTVAVLDSGVQASLPDLRGAVVPGGDTTGAGTNGMTDDEASTEQNPDQDGHGTDVAALIVGQGVDGGMVGIAPEAKILPVRVIGGTGKYLSEDGAELVAAGIRYAVGRGVQVINMSLAEPVVSGCAPELQDAVAYALQHNVVLVAGAGDSGASGNPPEEPGSCAGVLAVGAVSPNLTLWSGSEQQPYVAVAAPGNDMPFLGLDGRYFTDSYGTSAASAFVSGEAALIRSRYPSMPWYQVVQRIVNTALPEPAGGSVPNNSFGYGIVRIPGALNVSKYRVPAGDPNPVYDAYQEWLSSPQGQQFTAASHPGPRPSHGPLAAAPASSGGSAGLIAVIAAVVVVAAAGTALSVAALRRRHRRYT